MNADTPINLASSVELKSAIKLVPPEEQPKPPEDKRVDKRDELSLRYACCTGYYFASGNGSSLAAGSFNARDYKLVDLQGLLDRKHVPSQVRADFEDSRDAAPK